MIDTKQLLICSFRCLGSDPDPVDRISSPSNAPLASSTLKTRDIKIESLYRSRAQDRPPDPPSGRYVATYSDYKNFIKGVTGRVLKDTNLIKNFYFGKH